MSRRLFAGLTALALLAAGQSVQAAFAGGIILNATTTTANTGNINTATSYTMPNLVYLGSSTGDFNTFAPPTFAPLVPAANSPVMITGVNPNLIPNVFVGLAPGSFSFNAGVLGSFTASEYQVETTGTGTEAYLFLGLFTTGTTFAGDANAPPGTSLLASVLVNLTQTGGTGTIGGTYDIEIPPTVVPEPASAALLGLGLVSLGGLALRRRMAK